MDQQHPSDGDLLAAYLTARDEAAFEALVRRHQALVFGVCYRVLGRTQDAEDAAQAVFLTLAHKAAALRCEGSLAGWLHHVAWQVALNVQRRAAAQTRTEKEARMMNAREQEEARAWEELRPLLDREIDRLPDKFRLPVLLHLVEGRTKEETALILGWNEGTVSSRLDRGKELLRSRLARRGVTLSVGLLAAVISSQAVAVEAPAAFAAAAAKAAGLLASGKLALVASAGAAAAAGTGGTGAGVVSAKVLALTKGALTVMFIEKLKLIAAVLVTVAALGSATGVALYRAQAEEAQALPAAPAKEEPSAELRVCLAQTLDARYRRACLAEVLADLRERAKLPSACPASLAQSFVTTQEADGVTVQSILEEAAKAGQADLDCRRDAVVFWQKSGDTELLVLQKKLKESAPEARCEAACDLARLADPRACTLLFEALRDREPLVATWALNALLAGHRQTLRFAVGVEDAAKGLAPRLDEKPVDLKVVELLLAMRHPVASGAVKGLLERADQEALGRLSEAVRRSGDAALIEAWNTANLKLDPAAAARGYQLQPARETPQAQDPRSAEALLAQLDGENQAARKKAGEDAGKTAEGGMPLTFDLGQLAGRDLETRRQSAVALGRTRDPLAVKALDERLAAAVAELIKSPAPAEDDWKARSALSPFDNYRTALAQGLGETRSPEALARLLELARHEDARVRALAADGLGGLGVERQALDSLLGLLADPEAQVRFRAALALANTYLKDRPLPDLCVLDPIQRLSQQADRAARKFAARALGEIQDVRVVQPLMKMYAAEKAQTYGNDARSDVVSAMVAINDPRLRDLLFESLMDKDNFAALTALNFFDQNPHPKLVEGLIKAIQASDWSGLRRRMARTLIHTGDPRGVDVVINLLLNGENMEQNSISFDLSETALARFPEAERQKLREALAKYRENVKNGVYNNRKRGPAAAKVAPVPPPPPPKDEGF